MRQSEDCRKLLRLDRLLRANPQVTPTCFAQELTLSCGREDLRERESTDGRR